MRSGNGVIWSEVVFVLYPKYPVGDKKLGSILENLLPLKPPQPNHRGNRDEVEVKEKPETTATVKDRVAESDL